MSSNFSFGSLTGVNGQKIDWNTLKKYDKNNDNVIDTDEYNSMIKDSDPDGFNGVSAFGSGDVNKDGKMSEEEFNNLAFKVKMGEFTDQYLELLGKDAPEGFKEGLYALVNKCAANIGKEGGVGSIEELKSMIDAYQAQFTEAKAKMDEIKNNTTNETTLIETVKTANSNGYVTAEEAAKMKKAASDYAIQMALKGDYSFLKALGANSLQIAEITKLVAESGSSTDPAAIFSQIKTKINSVIAKSTSTAIVNATKTIEDAKTKAEAAKNATNTTDYTVNSKDIDYSNIKGYSKNETVTVKKKGADGAKGEANKILEQLRAQIKAQIQAQCKASGVNFNESLFNSVFDTAKTEAMKVSIGGQHSTKYTHHSKSFFDTKTLVDNFVGGFNYKMSEVTQKLAASSSNETSTNSNGVPTYDSLTVGYLDKDDTTLTPEQKTAKNTQKTLLADPNGTMTEAQAKNYMETFSKEIRSQMIAKLGEGSSNAIDNLIKESISETLANFKSTTTRSDILKNFYNIFNEKYAAYKSSKTITA